MFLHKKDIKMRTITIDSKSPEHYKVCFRLPTDQVYAITGGGGIEAGIVICDMISYYTSIIRQNLIEQLESEEDE